VLPDPETRADRGAAVSVPERRGIRHRLRRLHHVRAAGRLVRAGLEVLAPDGAVIAHGGDVITDAGCGTGPGGNGVVICSIGGKNWEGG